MAVVSRSGESRSKRIYAKCAVVGDNGRVDDKGRIRRVVSMKTIVTKDKKVNYTRQDKNRAYYY